MRWFKHFSNAHNDNALNKVRMRFGADGYAIYWYCLELIAGDLEGENASFELSHDAEVIGFNLKVDQLRVEEIMKYMVDLQLFESANNKITCLKMAKFLEKKSTRNIEIHKIIDSFNELNNVVDKSVNVADKSKHSAPDEIRLDENINTYVPNDVVNCPHQEIINLFANNLPMLTQVKVLSEKRQSLLKTRWREDEKRQSLDWWDGFFKHIASSDFLTGKATDWQADIDWILKSSNFIKIIEGNYDNKISSIRKVA